MWQTYHNRLSSVKLQLQRCRSNMMHIFNIGPKKKISFKIDIAVLYSWVTVLVRISMNTLNKLKCNETARISYILVWMAQMPTYRSRGDYKVILKPNVHPFLTLVLVPFIRYTMDFLNVLK